MATVRDYTIKHYAVPAFLGKAVARPESLPFLFAVPIVILLAVLAGLGHLSPLPEGEIVFSKFLPIGYVEVIFTIAVGFAALATVAGGVRYFRAIEAQAPEHARVGSKGIVATVKDIFGHGKFRQCVEEAVGTRDSHKSHLGRTHLAVFYGFLGLVVTTASVGIGIYAFGYLTPWPVWHPVKILGNVSGVAVIGASLVFLYRRLVDQEKAGKSSYTDWLFLTALGLATVTGFLSEMARLAGFPIAYWVYFTHLVFIFFLLVYLPYSKFAHLAYRFVAMLYSQSRHV
jgi:quinone-modifying oxidoreductase subunit QmoC